MIDPNLPYTVEQWSRDGNRLEQVLARIGNVVIALAAFRAARGLRPRDLLMLRHGARVIERSDEGASQ